MYIYAHVCMLLCVPAVVGLPQSVRLSVLLEAIRNGRIFLLNGIQSLAFMVVAFLSIGYATPFHPPTHPDILYVCVYVCVGMYVCVRVRLWPVVSMALPVSVPPSLPPPVALLFVLVHIPLMALSILVGPAQVGRSGSHTHRTLPCHFHGMHDLLPCRVRAGGADEEHAAQEQLLPQPRRLRRPTLGPERRQEAPGRGQVHPLPPPAQVAASSSIRTPFVA